MPTVQRHASQADRQRAYRQRHKATILAALEAKGLPNPCLIPTMPSSRRWKALRQQAEQILSTLLAEMESYQADRSETWQESERAEAFQENIDKIQEAQTILEDID